MTTKTFQDVLRLKADPMHAEEAGPHSFTVQMPPDTLHATEKDGLGLLVRNDDYTPHRPQTAAPGASIGGSITIVLKEKARAERDAGDLFVILEDTIAAFVTPDTPVKEQQRIVAQLITGKHVTLTGSFTAPATAPAPALPVPAADPVALAPPAADPLPAAAADTVPQMMRLDNPAAPPVPVLGRGANPVAGNLPDVPDEIADRSAVLDVSKAFGQPAPVTLRRTTRPLTADIALWILVKRNSQMLSWDNYRRNLDLLFFPASANEPQPLYPEAAKLSRRRFLPFTDTDAYRALKVATEAFVVTWGAIVPTEPDAIAVTRLLAADARAIGIANERLGLDITADLPSLVDKYFDETGASTDATVPYLERVVNQLQGTGAAEVVETQAQFLRGQPDQCGDTCLWLSRWNNDFSAKLLRPPLVELIWSYWMEELQLVQTMNAVSRRFQNISSGPRDPLAQLELDALRPLNNLIWGWVQDEPHRLPIERRAAEYAHQYGLQLFGRAVPKMRTADNRSRFLEAFHTLLNLCVPFFRQADDTTVVPDGFPILNALREVHLILSEGAHNQFLDMPTTSRIEMLMQQWLLARTEFREYLPRRAMVAYPEPWMHSVESMRKLQGWGDTNTFQFWQLATMGEQIVSSIRWGDWNSINDPVNASNWATFFRPEIQAYIHSYRAVTGVDVSLEPVDVQLPGVHLLRRQRERKTLAA
ncbi:MULTISPECIES: hypothetical protein [Paraburkholderia]|uniref:hypothetical protein n=1 Tax=Paraburkholderia TaxID=1822464 RepID=UPI0003A110FD|nr:MULTISPECIES: hypothetical protein [Paraburkholderia]MDH6153318.1 hypothetical protein [Paraburkholderia sp. WSM4179]